MTDPTTDLDRCVTWCPQCYETSRDVEWAAEHHERTGHTTFRRAWRVERWGPR